MSKSQQNPNDAIIVKPSEGTVIGEYAYENKTNLVNVIIAEGVTEIREGAFSGCTSLESIFIPDSVTEIGAHAFQCCNQALYQGLS